MSSNPGRKPAAAQTEIADPSSSMHAVHYAAGYGRRAGFEVHIVTSAGHVRVIYSTTSGRDVAQACFVFSSAIGRFRFADGTAKGRPVCTWIAVADALDAIPPSTPAT